MKKNKPPPYTLENMCVQVYVYKSVHTHIHVHTQRIHAYIYIYIYIYIQNIFIWTRGLHRQLTSMGHLQTQNLKVNKIKTTYQNKLYNLKTNRRNLAVKSLEVDIKVQNMCSAQVYEMMIIKKLNTKFEIICAPIHAIYIYIYIYIYIKFVELSFSEIF